MGMTANRCEVPSSCAVTCVQELLVVERDIFGLQQARHPAHEHTSMSIALFGQMCLDQVLSPCHFLLQIPLMLVQLTIKNKQPSPQDDR